jgi:hypothetical protein
MKNPTYYDALEALVGDGVLAGGKTNGPMSDIFYVQDSPILPTEAEIQTKLATLIAEWTANQYQRDRQYPNLGEQLDMLFHDMTAGKGSKTGEWYKAIAKVKADNPK